MSDQDTLQFSPVPPDPRDTRRRRGWLAALVAALATLAIALPMAVYLLMRDDSGGPVEPAMPPAPSTAPPTPATPSPSSTPSSSGSATGAPDGRISLAVLGNSTLDIPRWPADNLQGPSGRLRFRNGLVEVTPQDTPAGRPPYGSQIVVLSATYGDIDRDGADETIALIGCLTEGGSKQLVAFDRDSQGRTRTVGTVVATTGEIREIRDDSARVTRDGTITVWLGDYQLCCGDEAPQSWQQRGYRRHAGRFEQVSGPTRMPVSPSLTETAVTAGELALGPVVDGYRYGILKVTVGHRRGTHPTRTTLRFYLPTGLEPAGTGWPPVTTAVGSISVTIAPPRAGGTMSRTFAFRGPATLTGGHMDMEGWGLDATAVQLRESVPWNNTAAATIRTTD